MSRDAQEDFETPRTMQEDIRLSRDVREDAKRAGVGLGTKRSFSIAAFLNVTRLYSEIELLIKDKTNFPFTIDRTAGFIYRPVTMADYLEDSPIDLPRTERQKVSDGFEIMLKDNRGREYHCGVHLDDGAYLVQIELQELVIELNAGLSERVLLLVYGKHSK